MGGACMNAFFILLFRLMRTDHSLSGVKKLRLMTLLILINDSFGMG